MNKDSFAVFSLIGVYVAIIGAYLGFLGVLIWAMVKLVLWVTG